MKENEMAALALVGLGVFSVDQEGRIWRHCKMVGSPAGAESHLRKLPAPRRAERSRSQYPTIMFWLNGKRYKVYAHRIVWMVVNQAIIPDKMEINHKDGIKTNPLPSNLELVTRQENVIHSFKKLPRKKKAQRGEMNASAKLTAQEVMEIRYLLQEKIMTQGRIAAKYGITQSAVSAIKTGKSWGHLIVE